VHWGLTNWEGALTKKGGAWGLKKEEGGGALGTNKRGRCIGGLKKGGRCRWVVRREEDLVGYWDEEKVQKRSKEKVKAVGEFQWGLQFELSLV